MFRYISPIQKKEREVLKLPPILTPYFVAVIPSPIGKKEEKNQKKKEEITDAMADDDSKD